MNFDFKIKLQDWSSKVNDYLNQSIPGEKSPYGTVYEAMGYSLKAGGKRIRPVLALAVCEILGGEENQILPIACTVEMIHTYSLIHDDLPAMDNDDFRRGRPTNHKVFGEGIAILAGDALLNTAYECMLNEILKHPAQAERYTRAAAEIAAASGVKGMIGGQVIDLESENHAIDGELLNTMHKCKTGALIKAPVRAAALICGATEKEFIALDTYAGNLGLAFQIKDDILDIEGSSEKMGKQAGSDLKLNKSTFVSIHGLEKSKELLQKISEEGREALEIFGEKAKFLKELSDYLLVREN